MISIAAAIRRKHPLAIVEAKCLDNRQAREARVSVLKRRLRVASKERRRVLAQLDAIEGLMDECDRGIERMKEMA